MSVLDDLLAGGPDHRATADIGGAIFAPVDDSKEALARFQTVTDRIIANDGMGYSVVRRLIHRSSEYAGDYIDRLAINIPG